MPNYIKLICEGCNNEFDRLQKVHNHNTKLGKRIYCSRKCFHANKGPYKKAQPSIIVDCEFCKQPFKKFSYVCSITNHNFCSNKCRGDFQKGERRVPYIQLTCPICKKGFERRVSYTRWRKFKHLFCSKMCSSIYTRNNPPKIKNPLKKSGIGRSRLEIFIESQLQSEFPHLPVIYNGKYAGYELDLYFPTLSLAVEINGPFHFIPIYSNESLIKTQNRDKMKITLCDQFDIFLFVIPIKEATKSIQRKRFYWLQLREVINNELQNKTKHGTFPDEIRKTIKRNEPNRI